MSDFEVLIEKAKQFHGGVCPGIVMGTRMTIAGLRELGMDPYQKNRSLLVYVEIDRCMSDAVQAITGCSLGHRNMKYYNYGKFAATFVDLVSKKAVRITIKETAGGRNNEGDLKEVAKSMSCMPESELLCIEEVRVDVPENDLPGRPRHKEICSVCGERIMDQREVIRGDKAVCKACAYGPYYTRMEAGI